MSKTIGTSASAEEKAEQVLLRMKPLLMEMIKRYDSSNRAVTLSDIEADAASRGDLLAKELIKLTLKQQDKATEQEIEEARHLAMAQANSECTNSLQADELCLTRIPGKERTLKTARGEIQYAREYLYFPELGSGVFPPGRTVRDTPKRNHAKSSKTTTGKTGRG